jgi:hypothetical protein
MRGSTFSRSLVFSVLGIAAVSACVSKSSGSSEPQASFDAGTRDVSFTDDVVAATDSGATPDGSSACPGVEEPDGDCNAVAQLVTTPVTGTCGTGAQPAGTGGTVVDGTYALTAQARYVDAGCTAATFEATMVITGGCFQRVDSTGTSELRRNGTFTTSGDVLTRAATCGAALPAATYTATATEVTIFDEGGSVTTWTKQ